MKKIALFLLLSIPLSFSIAEEELTTKPDGPTDAEIAPPKEEGAVEAATGQGMVTIGGTAVDYTVTADTIVLKSGEDEARASVFFVSYLRTVDDQATRPVVFAFNGGPGSSAVWLHLGALGPKIVPTSPDGTVALTPPSVLMDNPHSILDIADLVFIDPVSTGYSRVEGDAKPSEFHGLDQDIESVGDFIRRWTTENDRWGSPKYLLGESYGGIRAAGLARHLQSRFGMALNGVVLLSSLLDFRTLFVAPGDDLSFAVFLPAMAATAHYHGKVSGDRDALIEQVRTFANGRYTQALFAGASLADDEEQALAGELERFTSIPAQTWIENDLRLPPSRFRKELLRNEGKVLGRFDARVAWPAVSEADDYPNYDPSYAVAYNAFSTAMMDYLSRELDYTPHFPYEILNRKVHPWKWGSENKVVNLAPRLSIAMRDNPELRVLVMGGYTDLATPPDGVLYSINHLRGIPDERRNAIEYTWYEAGHMFYLNQPDLEKMRRDLIAFIR